MSKRVVVGMSGGVDSGVCAYLLKEQGYEVIGVTLLTGDSEHARGEIRDAKAVADYLGIDHEVFDVSHEFGCRVVDVFTGEYLSGRTPNPCIECNKNVKWQGLIIRAESFGAKYIATGHYARIIDTPSGRLSIAMGKDASKDQTYVLYRLSQDELKKTLFPLGEYTKEEVRAIAREVGIPVAQKQDSQDICFIPEGDYAAFIKSHTEGPLPGEGNFVDTLGNVLGRHKGIFNYTVGQRRGLNISLGKRTYVKNLDVANNRVILCDDEELFTQEIRVKSLSHMGVLRLGEDETYDVRIRYSHRGTACNIKYLGDELVIHTAEPVRAPTPGQSAVIYSGGYIAAGGIIE